MMRCALALTLLCAAGAVSLRSAPVKAAEVKAPKAAVSDEAKIKTLRSQLEATSAGLAKLLVPNATMTKMKVGGPMKAFETQLQQTLKETASMKDQKECLKRLQSAQEAMHGLVKDMNDEQMRIMKENTDQKVSLLLGVLMTKQRHGESYDDQMEVLKSDDFAGLAVTKAIIAAHDFDTPIFQQVANFLDGKKPTPNPLDAPLKAGKDGKPDVSALVNALQLRLDNLEKGAKNEKKLHEKVDKELDAGAKKEAGKNSKKGAHRIQLVKKSEDRKFKKQSALSLHDIDSLKTAIAAIKKGDLKALVKAQTALQDSIKAMQSNNGGFLVLIQTWQRVQGLDCPYCAAQCVDKCHTGGNSYSTCLVQCADAGK